MQNHENAVLIPKPSYSDLASERGPGERPLDCVKLEGFFQEGMGHKWKNWKKGS